MTTKKNRPESPQDTTTTNSLPSWASAAFQVTASDDVMDYFYAPTVPTFAVEDSQPDNNPATTEISAIKPIVEDPTASDSTGRSNETPPAPRRRNLLGRATRTAKEIGRVAVSQERVTDEIRSHLLTELLPGKALDLYSALYERTLAAKPARASVRLTKNDLRSAAKILNVKTINTHERYLLAMGLISRQTLAGDHEGSTYTVKSMDEIGLDGDVSQSFQVYLSKRIANQE